MEKRRIGRPFVAVVVLGAFILSLQSGCGDDSRTSGTQVEISPQAKAQIKDMKDMYKNLDKGDAKKKKKK